MWRMVLRDLQWRRRRFAIAGLATSLLFALTLLLTGVSTAVHLEGKRTIDRFKADAWLLPDKDTTPFTSPPRIPLALADEVARIPGVTRADPVLTIRSTVADGDELKDINMIALPPSGIGWPKVKDGKRIPGEGEVIVDTTLGFDLGDHISIGGHELAVVGRATHVAYLFGIPAVFTRLDETVGFALHGAPVVSTIIVHGHPRGPWPAGVVPLDTKAVRDGLERPIKRGTDSIDLVLTLLEATAAGIVGLMVYLTSIERTADLAVLRATGSTRRFMAGGLALQSLMMSLGAALIAVVISKPIAGFFPVALEVQGSAYVTLLTIAAGVGLLASVAGVWRAVRTDPATAFGGG